VAGGCLGSLGAGAIAVAGVNRAWLKFLYLLYCVEAGVFLLLAPWSLLWIHSYFAQIPGLRELLLSGYLRGAVSGFGAILLMTGAVDFAGFCRAMKRT
jgi:hypothetical protein